jgi:putative glycosyltransferase
MELSIVTTMYQSEAYLKEFYSRSRAEARRITDDYEIIFVNDGSPDKSLDVALELYAEDPKVKVIDLSRNFGHHKAAMTGLSHAKGKLVFLIDCDLEEEPELLGRFHRELIESKADVVYGVQDKRKGGILERVTGHLFFSVFNLLSDYPIPRNIVMARLMTKRYVKSLIQHRDREVFMAGLWAITGYAQIPSVIHKGHRGTSSYTWSKKLAIVANSITSFSSKPLVLISYVGAIISLFAFVAGLYLIVRRLFFQEYLEGWASLIVSIWFLGGLTIFCLGIIGIYVARVFSETKERPYTIIRDVFDRSGDLTDGI